MVALLCALLASCAPAREPAVELTAAAQNATLSTEVANARASATYGADQRAATQVAASDVISRARGRQNSMISTLEALDIPRPDVRQITPAVLPTSLIQNTPTPDTLAAGGVTLAAPTQDPNTTPTFTPAPTDIPPTQDPNAPRIANLMTAPAVGRDDCAQNPTTSFRTTTSQIYVVMLAYNLSPGNVVASRWFKDGQAMAFYEFSPNFTVNGACIWFFVDQTDFTFEAGANYEIVLSVNGVSVDTARFTVE